MGKHYRDMKKAELLLLVQAQGYAALDIAQSLNFTNDWLKDEYKAEAYKNAEAQVYELASMAFDFDPVERGNVDITILGAGGATHINTDLGSMLSDNIPF